MIASGHGDLQDWFGNDAAGFSASGRSRARFVGTLPARLARRRGTRRSKSGAVGDLALARRRSQPVGDLGPQARRPRGGPGTIPLDRDPVPGRADFRASPAAGDADGPVALVRSVHHDAAPIHETGHQLLQTGRLCRAGEEHPHLGSVVARLERSQGRSAAVRRPSRPDRKHGSRHPPRAVGRLAGAGVMTRSTLDADPAALDFDPTIGAGSRTTLPRRWRAARSGSDPAPAPDERTALDRARPECLRPERARARSYATLMVGRPSDRAACWPGGWSRPASAWSRSTCSRRSSTASPGTATARRPSARWTTTPTSLLPTFDQAFAALIDDLERRGRLETTLVVAAGEFGRTPRLNAVGRPRPLAGRLERRPGRRRRSRRTGRRLERRARRLSRRPARHAPGPAGHDLSQPGHRCERSI